MIVFENPESRGLLIAEGFEKALSAAYALNVEGWAAGGQGFIPALADAVPDDTECVTLIVDRNQEAQKYIGEAATTLDKRGIQYRAVRLPKDPDEIQFEQGLDALRAAIDNPGNVVDLEVRRGPRLLWERDALKLREPQDWMVEGILEKGYLYSITGRSGSGKTAVALLIGYLMASPDIYPRLLGTREVERGTVVFLAGENPVDVIRRMDGLRGHYGLKEEASLALVRHTFSIKDNFEVIAEQIPQDQPLSMVVVDTTQAFFPGTEENSNSEMIAYAQTLRQLTKLPGNPTVICLSHPAKFAAAQADLLPRGGSAFLAEIDGNLTLWSNGESDQVFELHHTDKLRGPGFEPIKIELLKYTDETFIDTRGRPSYTVVAKVITEQEADTKADAAYDTKTQVIDALKFNTAGMTQSEVADVLKTHRSTAKRMLDRLVADKLVEKKGSTYLLRATKPSNKRNKTGEKDD